MSMSGLGQHGHIVQDDVVSGRPARLRISKALSWPTSLCDDEQQREPTGPPRSHRSVSGVQQRRLPTPSCRSLTNSRTLPPPWPHPAREFVRSCPSEWLNSRETGFEAFYSGPGLAGADEKGGVEGEIGPYRQAPRGAGPREAPPGGLNALP